MDPRTIQILFPLLRSAIRGGLLTQEERALFADELMPELMAIADMHDVTHLLEIGLNQNELPENKEESHDNKIVKVIYRYSQLDYELGKICQALEEADIRFIPLKGAVLRFYYPEPWMRTSCDIDVLVREEDLEHAASCLIKARGYTRERMSAHDISLFGENHMHLELHYNLLEDGWANSSSDVLKEVWDHVVLSNGSRYCYEMRDDLFYFYHIAHMAKHFELGGCGIKPLIDLWLLDHIDGADHAGRDALLKRGNLLRFAEKMRRLSRVWFDNAEHDALTQQMEYYILRGGVFGTTENHVMIQQQRAGGRKNYFFSRIFLPYSALRYQFPILQKHRWLTPLLQIVRWFKILFCGRRKKAMLEFRYNRKFSSVEAENIQAFLENVGL